MKLQDLTFDILSDHGITKLPTTTDASRIATSKLGFDMWKQEFERFFGSDVKLIDRGVIWGGIAIEVTDMKLESDRYITAKQEALSWSETEN